MWKPQTTLSSSVVMSEYDLRRDLDVSCVTSRWNRQTTQLNERKPQYYSLRPPHSRIVSSYSLPPMFIRLDASTSSNTTESVLSSDNGLGAPTTRQQTRLADNHTEAAAYTPRSSDTTALFDDNAASTSPQCINYSEQVESTQQASTDNFAGGVTFSSKLPSDEADVHTDEEEISYQPRARVYTSAPCDFFSKTNYSKTDRKFSASSPVLQSDVEENDNNCNGFATGNLGLSCSPGRAELNDFFPPSGGAASNLSSAGPDSGIHATTGGTFSASGSSCSSIPDSSEATEFVDVPDGASLKPDAMLLSMKNKSPTLVSSSGNGGANNNQKNAASLLAAAIAASAASAGGCTKQHSLTSAAADSLTSRRFSVDQPLTNATLLMVQNSLNGMSLMHPSNSTSELPDERLFHLTDEQKENNDRNGLTKSELKNGLLLGDMVFKRTSPTVSNVKTVPNVTQPAAAAATDHSAARAMLMRFFEQSNHASEFLPPAGESHAPPPFRRSKSLKTSAMRNTAVSPGGEKKMVRFADALGLDLSEVKIFFQQDIPDPLNTGGRLMSESDDDDELLAQQGLSNGKSSPPGTISSDAGVIAANDPLLNALPRGPSLIALFSPPGLADNFIDRVRDNKVCLESVTISDTKIDGSVRVFNVAFGKEVFLRYTFNEWQSSIDKQAQFSETKSDGLTDRFSFTFYAPPYMSRGAFLEFCICYRAGGSEWWDSNYGRNYRLECFESL